MKREPFLARVGSAFARGWSVLRGGDDRVFAATTPHSADRPENERYWRSLGTATIRDISPAMQRAAQDDSARAFQRFSLCRRPTAVIRGFVVGAGGVRPKSDEPRVQQLLDQFWDDRDNRIEERVGEWSNDLSVFGELCLVLATGQDSRHTKVGLVDLSRVEDVVADPEDAGRLIAVVVKFATRSGDGRRAHPIVTGGGGIPREFGKLAPGATIELPVAGSMVPCVVGGPCVWARINALASQSRGLPDPYPALDALALRDRSSFSFMERLSLMAAFIWDLAMPTSKRGADVEKEAQRAAKAIGAGTGGVYAHTENMALEAKAPDIKAADWKEGLRIPLQDILTAYGHPEHWYAGGPEMSNASAGEMGSPTWTALQERQLVIRRVLKSLGDYALAQFPELGTEAHEWDVTLPIIAGKDAVREITVFNSELNALATMRDLGLEIEAVQREAQARANEYGFRISDDEWEEPEEFAGLPMPGATPPAKPGNPVNVAEMDPERDAGARVGREGDPSDSKPVASPGSPGRQGREAA